MLKSLVTGSLFLLAAAVAQSQSSSVSFEKWLSLRQAGAAILSPDGAYIAYTVTSTDWKENTYDVEIWLHEKGRPPFQLTRTGKGSSTSPNWSPDSKWIAFLADRGDKSQIYLISIQGGEAFPLTKEEEGINDFSWSPDGRHIAFTKNDPETPALKSTKDRYGAFGEEGREYKLSHLWTVPFDFDSLQSMGLLPCYPSKSADSTHKSGDCNVLPKPTRLTEGNFTVTGFDWSPDGSSIAYTRQPDPLINSSIHADIAVLELASKKSTTIVANPAGDALIAWSPEGDRLLYGSSVTDTVSQFYKNNRLFIYQFSNGHSTEIAADFDEDKFVFDWNPKGIFFGASQKTSSALFHLDPASGAIQPVSLPLDIVGSVRFSKDGNTMALSARSFAGLAEIYTAPTGIGTPNATGQGGPSATGAPLQQITHLSDQLRGWNTPVNEVIQWKSKDGALIEGILLKPRDYDEKKKYPLLVVIHGGPTGVDRPEPTPTYVYPILQWCEKGALVLRVNYRGSAGYGAKFRALNVRNLGVGDMWDVVSGVEYLQKKGMIDTSRMGCMGWSQGGYISAFLTTHTSIFKAISVGAGISDWATYYVSTDITPFTRQYLKATPWEDKAIYEKTSPIAAINNARTPTLIQHGELDKRVPISDAYELYRGLQDRNIPSRLIVYKGFGHGITKPKERLAAIWHNWQWFGKYIWGEDIALPLDKSAAGRDAPEPGR
ncbi:MAG TPA: S9 family peptidase [Puia sp.]|nr:S9 family peptidase [Puia sp.]